MRHPDEDELIALALGTLPGEPTELLRHLATCPACRTAYHDVSGAVDAVLPAAPRVSAPTGFDARVLDRLELRRPSTRRRRRRVPLLVAAAAAAGIGLGALGAALLGHDTAPAGVTVSDGGAPLVTSSGSTVGTVAPSRAGSEHVVVMEVTAGRPGTHYTCRLVLKDGSARDVGQWWTPSSGQATWIAYGSASSIDRVELVQDDGRIWSTADLDG
ncbi:anti-sigma factor family protein [Streptomyces brasiliensis]|uniref:Zinc-finger domain-containing protein n=1 Tax=Streptomyces brasiliensis TaxID=1954 RepID=A0A917NMA7_9ACTN|nr:hypothetical protein [Streptomyces brasiliensis]GGJ08620.1 hypothetical protein GCM10010121_018680 [Streptomyces brasiliensis]